MITSTDWIQTLGLVPHPEGGYYREFYRSPVETGKGCSIGTVIYYLLTGNDFSAFHSLSSHEIWHFHHGSAFLIHIIDPRSNYRRVRLGTDAPAGETPCFVIPAGHWFGAEVAEENSFALASCTVMPGFSYDGFIMPSREQLISQFPDLREEIVRLTRKEQDTV